MAPKKSMQTNSFSGSLLKLFFGYTLPLFYLRTKRGIEGDDVYPLYNNDKSELLRNKLEKYWQRELDKGKKYQKYKPSLTKALCGTFKWDVAFEALIFAVYQMISIATPLVLWRVVKLFGETTIPGNREKLVISCVSLLVLSGLRVIIYSNINLYAYRLSMRLRIATTSLMFKKITSLHQCVFKDKSSGEILNLFATDAHKYEHLFYFFQSLWIAPVLLVCLSILLCMSVSWLAITGIATILFLIVPFLIFLSKVTKPLNRQLSERTDRRLLHIKEVLSGIQVIKMYAWEMPFEKLVQCARNNEASINKKLCQLYSVLSSTIIVTDRIAIYVAVVFFVVFDQNLHPELVFMLSVFYQIIHMMVTLQFTMGLKHSLEALVVIERMKTLMMLPEISNDQAQTDKVDDVILAPSLDTEIKSKQELYTLIQPDSIKTEIVQELNFPDLNHELKVEKVKNEYDVFVNVENVNAAWDLTCEGSTTLRNINLTLEKGRTYAVVGSVGCGKTSLLNLLIGELNLFSGKINKSAKITYSSQEAWLINGSIRENILFGATFNSNRYKNVLEVCCLQRDFEQLPAGENTMVGEGGGVSVSGGQRTRINLARAIYQQADVYLLDDPLSAVDVHVAKMLLNDCILNFLRGKTVVLATHQVQFLKELDHIIVLDEGKIAMQGTYSDLQKSNLDVIKSLKLTDVNEELESNEQNESKQINLSEINKKAREDDEEIKQSGSIPFKLYHQYLRYGSSWPCIITVICINFLNQGLLSFADIWISNWMNKLKSNDGLHPKANDDSFIGSKEYYIYLYGGIIFLAASTALLRSYLDYTLMFRSSVAVHRLMFQAVLRAPMAFFDRNPIGRILNRFSKDIMLLDFLFPLYVTVAAQSGIGIIGQASVILFVNPIMIIPLLMIVTIGFFWTKLYIRTSQDLQRIEANRKSPIFSHVSISLNGLSTIRVHNSKKWFVKQYDGYQDAHTSAYYMCYSTRFTFLYWSDVCGLLLFITQVTIFLMMSDEVLINLGNTFIGLSLMETLLILSVLQVALKQIVDVAATMVNVERVIQFTKINTEDFSATKNAPPVDWPQTGEITFDNFSMKYDSSGPAVLNDINVHICSGEKIGIVGRTGAGKSSFISSLFRFSYPEGKLIIDGVDSQDVDLVQLRSRISIIPQMPVMFSATLRFNLDPSNEHTDEAIWTALEQVKMKAMIKSLDESVSGDGNSFSMGQRQLLCLARALLRKNKILILDEATANVDMNTERLIKKTLSLAFSDCTVLTIAHRLHTIMDSDRVIVIDGGKLVEFDHPYILLKDPKSYFSRLVYHSEPKQIGVLLRQAQESYEGRSSLIMIDGEA